MKIRGGVFGNEELGLPGDHPESFIGSIGGEPILGHEITNAPEERREEIACDHRDCLRQRLVINGSAVDQPKGWATDTWFHVNGKDYCPDHGPSYGAAGGAAEALSADGTPSPYPVSDYLTAELAEAERMAGLSSERRHLERESSPPVDYSGYQGVQGDQGFSGPTPEPLPRRTDPRQTTLSWVTVLLIAAVFVLSGFALALWIDLDSAQLEIAVNNKSSFEDKGHIRSLDCQRQGNTFQCSGEVIDATRPVRYFCDKNSCHFECEK